MRAALSYYVHRPSLGGQEIFPKDGGHLGRETIFSLFGEHLFVERRSSARWPGSRSICVDRVPLTLRGPSGLYVGRGRDEVRPRPDGTGQSAQVPGTARHHGSKRLAGQAMPPAGIRGPWWASVGLGGPLGPLRHSGGRHCAARHARRHLRAIGGRFASGQGRDGPGSPGGRRGPRWRGPPPSA